MGNFSRRKLAVVMGAMLLPCAELALAAAPTVEISKDSPLTAIEVGTEVKFTILATDTDNVGGKVGGIASVYFCRQVGVSRDTDLDDCEVVVADSTSAVKTYTRSVTKSFGPVTGSQVVYYAYAVDGDALKSADTDRVKFVWFADVTVDTGNINALQGQIDAAAGTETQKASILVKGKYNGKIVIKDKQFLTLVGVDTDIVADTTSIVGSTTSDDVVSISNSKGIKFLGFTIGNVVPGSETGWGKIRGRYGIFVAGGDPDTSQTVPTGWGDRNVIGYNRVQLTASSGIRVEGARYVEVRNNVVEKTNAGSMYMYYKKGTTAPLNTNGDAVTDTNWLIEEFIFPTSGPKVMKYRPYIGSSERFSDTANDCDLAYDRESRPGSPASDKPFRPNQEMISVTKLRISNIPTFRESNNVNVVRNEVFNGPWTINGVCVIGKEGIDLKSGSSFSNANFNYVHDLHKLGIYVDAYADNQTNNIVNGNIVHNTKNGIALSAENERASDAPISLKKVLVSNNRVHNNTADGIIITKIGSNEERDNIQILNNTVVGNQGNGINIDTTQADHVYIVNNLVSNNALKQIVRHPDLAAGTYVSQNNLVWKSNTPCTADSLGNAIGTGLVCAPPKFNLVGDYSLQPASPTSTGSPAINKGFKDSVSVGGVAIDIKGLVKKDATGADRPVLDGIYDIGAMERLPQP